MTTVVMDKTGTLTKGEFKVQKVLPANGFTKEELLEMAAYGEALSTHPIAQSIRTAYGKNPDSSRLSDSSETAGHGVKIRLDGRQLMIGNSKLMESAHVAYAECKENGTIVYVSLDGKFAGAIVISDTVKEGAADAVAAMKKAGIRRTVMLTGDRKSTADAVASGLGIDEVHAELLPGDKVGCVEKLLGELSGTKNKLGFVGDGINDAPVLMRADVGIAMGSLGSDAAIEAADIVLMDDDIAKIPAIIRIARKTLRIVKSNVFFAITVKLLILLLSVFGLASMWAAVFADVGVAVICILNSMRALKVR